MSPSAEATPPRRRILPYALGAAALVVAVALACSQAGTPQPGGISGTYDLARVGSLVFVTSADLSELRVIDAHSDGGPNGTGPKDWVRAPNPLESLEIPVAGRPVGLTRDLRYTVEAMDGSDGGEVIPDGGEVTGPYVYAFAGGRSQISVVGAGPKLLREVSRLSANGPVTAASAQGPSGAGPSTLYYATLVGGTGQLWSVDFAPPDQIQLEGQPPPAPQLLLQMDAGEAISALQVLPAHQELAVATRLAFPDAGLVTGQAFAVRPSTGAVRPLAFGAPIRILATHPGTSDGRFPPEEKLFGVVDEESCGGGGARGCARILTVDVANGQPALDFSGQPALPILFERGLPRALTFMANGKVRSAAVTKPDAGGLADLPLVGLVTNTDGTLVFFEAVGRPSYEPDDGGLPPPAPQWTLRHVNQSLLVGSGNGFFYEDAGGAAFPTLPLPQDCDAGVARQGLQQCSVRTGLGTAVAEQVTVLFQGAIPDLVNVPTTDADLQRFPAPGRPISRVELGDRIVVSTAAGSCGELSVTSKTATDLETTDAIPSGCVNRTSFTVRAADPTPYVVLGQFSGYMGRTGDESTFEVPGATPYYRPDPVLSSGGTPPALHLEMGVRPAGIERDFRYVFQTTTGFTPLFFVLSTDPSTGWPGYHLPYGVTAMPDAPRIFLSYPSVPRTALLGSGAVIELNPTLMAPSEANSLIGAFYR